MTWQPRSYEEGLRMAWDEDDDGVDHCLTKIEPYLLLAPGSTVLDIGCGVGRLTVPLAQRHPDVTFVGLDPSARMIRLAERSHSEPNVHFVTRWTSDFLHSAFSVVTFQHMTDRDMQAYLRRVAPRPFVFQFVAGSEREPLSMQRSPVAVMQWCEAAGFTDIEVSGDERFPNWRWVYAC